MSGVEIERIGDDAVFRTLYQIHLLGLTVDAHVLVDDADAALTGNGDGHAVLGDGVHGRAHHGHVQLYFFGQLGGQIHVSGQNIALRRDQQHVVEGQPFAHKAVGIHIVKLHMKLPLPYTCL